MKNIMTLFLSIILPFSVCAQNSHQQVDSITQNIAAWL